MLGAGLAVLAAVAGAAQAGAQTRYVAHAAPLSGPGGSHPFNAAAFNRVPENLAEVGYRETEYLLSGQALAYTYADPASTSDDVVPVQLTPVSYVNRILVRMPTDAARFSGNVVVELANDALNTDSATAWSLASSRFTGNGDAYVLLTSRPVGEASLKQYAPARYRALNWPNVAATTTACGAGPEGGIIYDEITQLGTLLRSSSSDDPLPGSEVKALYLYGYSDAATTLLTYDRVFGMNSRLYDAYFVASGGFRAALNGCEPSSVALSRTAPPASNVSAVFQTQTISERTLAAASGVTLPSGTDSDAPTRYRYYDIAGSAHVTGDLARGSPELSDYPDPADDAASFTQAEAVSLCHEPAGSLVSAFPNRYVYDAIWADLEDWVRSDVAPPRVGRQPIGVLDVLGLDPPGSGGWRSPAVDVQTQAYLGGSLILSDQIKTTTFCALLGYQRPDGVPTVEPFYDAAIVADVGKLEAGRFLTAADAATLTADPALATEYPDGTDMIPE